MTIAPQETKDFHWRERCDKQKEMFEKKGGYHPDDLLSKPSQTHKTCERQSGNFSDCSDRFLLKDKTFSRQYAHLYAERLWEVRPKVEASARKKWGINRICFVSYLICNILF